MNKQILTIIASCLMVMFVMVSPPDSGAQEIVIVNSAPIKPYQEAIDAFNKTVGLTHTQSGINSIQPFQTHLLKISKDETPQQINKKLNNLQPRLIVAVGSKALKSVQNYPLPIVYLMVPNPQDLIGRRPHISGIKMLVAARHQLETIHSTLPRVRILGEIYNPSGNDLFLSASTSRQAPIKVLAEAADSPKMLKKALDQLKGRVDALWIPPDPTIITPATLDLLTLFSMNNGVPLIAFAPKYIRHGAAIIIYSRPADMGEQAAQLAMRLLAGTAPEPAVQEYSKTIKVISNKKVLENLGINMKLKNNSAD